MSAAFTFHGSGWQPNTPKAPYDTAKLDTGHWRAFKDPGRRHPYMVAIEHYDGGEPAWEVLTALIVDHARDGHLSGYQGPSSFMPALLTRYVVVGAGRSPAGYVGVEPDGTMTALYVRGRYRSQGLGAELVRRAIDDLDCTRVLPPISSNARRLLSATALLDHEAVVA